MSFSVDNNYTVTSWIGQIFQFSCYICLFPCTGSLCYRGHRQLFIRSVKGRNRFQMEPGSIMLQVLISDVFNWCKCILQVNTFCSTSPGHLPVKIPDYNNRLRILVATYVTFSPDGTELLVNMGGEQVITTVVK